VIPGLLKKLLERKKEKILSSDVTKISLIGKMV
jgi:hypothetical protein